VPAAFAPAPWSEPEFDFSEEEPPFDDEPDYYN
jgi:hypothetical protein